MDIHESMLDLFATDVAHNVSHLLELIGVVIIAATAIATLGLFLYRLALRKELIAAATAFRSSFGRAILLGLEFLIAADIINTVAVRPTLEGVAVLAGIVAIRTFLSFSLEVEIEGRWPWQRGPRRKREA
jgi:uncharacterized membrane protein